MSRSAASSVGLGVAAIACGLTAVGVAIHDGRLTTYAGTSGWAAALDLTTGWALVASGLGITQLRPGSVTGPLAAGAGLVWFAPDFAGWQGGPAPARSVGMLVTGLWLALLVHAVVAFPRGLVSFWARALVGTTYVATAVVAVGFAVFRDPFADADCWSNCTDNSFLIHSDPSIARALAWFDLRFPIVLAVAFVTFAVRRVATATAPTRRLVAPILATVAAVTVFHAAHALALLRTPIEDPQARGFAALFGGQSLAACGVAAALAWVTADSRRARRAMDRLVLEFSELPKAGGLRAALVRAIGDPTLTIAYPLRDSGRFVDGQGRTIPAPGQSAGRAVTPIAREGRQIALVEHDAAVIDGSFEERIGSAARLVVENERIQAETLARVLELRESRARIVGTGDAVSRRLERDLHDGAQQRLVALTFALRIAQSDLGPEADPRALEPLVDAERSLAKALAAVRAVAHGLYPVTLTTSGLAYAVDELAELTAIRVEVGSLPDRRLPPPVEAAAYGVIREAVENAARHRNAQTVSISATLRSHGVFVETTDDGTGDVDVRDDVGLLDLEDRVGALGGQLTIRRLVGGSTRIEAQIPCE